MSKKIMLIILFIVMIFNLSACSGHLTDIEDYDLYVNEIYWSDQFMPDLKSLGEYESVEVFYDDFPSKSITLSVGYSEETYENAKINFLNEHEYLSEPLMNGDIYLIPNHEFEYATYMIQVVDNEGFSYPEQFGMIGYSDKHNRICFLYFYDRSLGRMGDDYSMEEFVEDYFVFVEE